MRTAAMVVVVLLFYSGMVASAQTAQPPTTPQEAAIRFLTARSYQDIAPLLTDETRTQMSQFDPEVLEQGFAMIGSVAGAVSGRQISGVSVTAGTSPSIKVNVGADGSLEYRIQDQAVTLDKATLDFAIRFVDKGQEILESPFASRLVMTMIMQGSTWRVARMVATGPADFFTPAIFQNLAEAIMSEHASRAVGAIRWVNHLQLLGRTRFTCDPAQLLQSDFKDVPADRAAELKNHVLKDGEYKGYRFAFSGCTNRGDRFQVSAEPIRPGKSGRDSFCSDETGVIYKSESGSGKICLLEKKPIS